MMGGLMGGGMGSGMGMGIGMGLGMLFGWIFWLLILAAIIYTVMSVLRRSGTGSQSDTSAATNETPLAILKRRYAAGEIDQTQYESMKSQLA